MEMQQKIQLERMDGGSISNDLTSKNSQNVTYWANPMPLETQWTLCDEVGILKGNILMDRKTLFEGVLDDDEVLDLMSERLTGDPGITDMHYAIVDTTSDKVVMCTWKYCRAGHIHGRTGNRVRTHQNRSDNCRG